MGRMGKCGVPTCKDDAICRGWCGKHYRRWRRTGNPEGLLGRPLRGTHYSWKGEQASIAAKHRRVWAVRGKATVCIWGCVGAGDYDWANLTGNYDDVMDYASMCRPCHRRYDDARRSMEEGFVKHPRGASMPGERNPSAKLTREKVEECKQRYAAGERVVALAREFGVSHAVISGIISGKRWRQEAA